LYKNWEVFRTSQRDVNENSRVPSLLRKELGEKYCQEFCNVFTLDHERHGDATAEDAWRKGECFNACAQAFPRCHTMEKCVKNEWFPYTQKIGGE